MEEWKAIPGYEGYYEASSLGRVRSIPRTVQCRTAHGMIERRRKGKVLSPLRFSKTGYIGFQLSKDNSVKFELAHRLVAITFLGLPEAGMICAHLDGTRNNNVKSNLAWVTPTENQAHRIAHGTANIGESAHQAKLSESDVREALELRKQGVTFREIGEKFGVHFSTIQHAVSGKNWSRMSR